MLKRLRSLVSLRPEMVYGAEAVLVSLFMIQSLRFLIGAVYADIGSASLYPALDPSQIDPNLPGLTTPRELNSTLSFVAYMLALPLLVIVIGRFRWTLVGAVVLAAIGRYLMLSEGNLEPDVNGAALTVGAGLLYLTILVRHRARYLPVGILLALATDQLLRAQGDTLDPSWDTDAYLNVQFGLSLVTVLLALIAGYMASRQRVVQTDEADTLPERSLITPWGGIGFGALLFAELAMFALPNVVARRAGVDYVLLVPFVMMATLLPLVPWLRQRARYFLGLFDSSVRGWVWMLVVMLLLVLGLRISGMIAAAALVVAQLGLSMMWWWLYRPAAKRERDLSGLWMVLGVAVFLLLSTADVFTFEYAYVRDFSESLDFLNPLVPSLLRGFRGMGLAVFLLAILLAVMPMVQMQRRIPWRGSVPMLSFGMVLVVLGFGMAAAYAARPPVVRGITEPQNIRIGSYNIHSGFNEYFHYNPEMQARTMEFSGANVILLQEVEAGRMTSFGVDQPLWFARRLGMDVRFYPTVEGLQGLAVLSDIEIVFDDGRLLDSTGLQTGLQRVQVRPDPDENVITLYNTWLEPLLATNRSTTETVSELESAQEQQLQQVLATIARQHPDGRLGRMVVGGTFNNVPSSDVAEQMRQQGFVDHFAGEPPEVVATFRRTGVSARLDYLWTTVANAFQVVGFDVINDLARGVIPWQASDHLLLYIAVHLE